MAISARNQFAGKIVSVHNGAVMSEVVIDIGGGHEIVSLISASSYRDLQLQLEHLLDAAGDPFEPFI